MTDPNRPTIGSSAPTAGAYVLPCAMPGPPDDTPFSDVDVRSLAAKLKGLHALLTPAEQALLHLLLRRAAERDDPAPDVTGFAWAVSFNPFPYLDALAAEASRPPQSVAPYDEHT